MRPSSFVCGAAGTMRSARRGGSWAALAIAVFLARTCMAQADNSSPFQPLVAVVAADATAGDMPSTSGGVAAAGNASLSEPAETSTGTKKEERHESAMVAQGAAMGAAAEEPNSGRNRSTIKNAPPPPSDAPRSEKDGSIAKKRTPPLPRTPKTKRPPPKQLVLVGERNSGTHW